jgi:hypothetical protein
MIVSFCWGDGPESNLVRPLFLSFSHIPIWQILCKIEQWYNYLLYLLSKDVNCTKLMIQRLVVFCSKLVSLGLCRDHTSSPSKVSSLARTKITHGDT